MRKKAQSQAQATRDKHLALFGDGDPDAFALSVMDKAKRQSEDVLRRFTEDPNEFKSWITAVAKKRGGKLPDEVLRAMTPEMALALGPAMSNLLREDQQQLLFQGVDPIKQTQNSFVKNVGSIIPKKTDPSLVDVMGDVWDTTVVPGAKDMGKNIKKKTYETLRPYTSEKVNKAIGELYGEKEQPKVSALDKMFTWLKANYKKPQFLIPAIGVPAVVATAAIIRRQRLAQERRKKEEERKKAVEAQSKSVAPLSGSQSYYNF